MPQLVAEDCTSTERGFQCDPSATLKMKYQCEMLANKRQERSTLLSPAGEGRRMHARIAHLLRRE